MQRSALCRSRRELSNAYFLAKFGFDAAENEPCEVFTIDLPASHPLREFCRIYVAAFRKTKKRRVPIQCNKQQQLKPSHVKSGASMFPSRSFEHELLWRVRARLFQRNCPESRWKMRSVGAHFTACSFNQTSGVCSRMNQWWLCSSTLRTALRAGLRWKQIGRRTRWKSMRV